MDGTIYLGNTLIEGTLSFLNELTKQEKRAIYITNNSSKAVTQYVEKLSRLGIAAQARDFCTSAHAMVFHLKNECPGAKIFLLGTPALEQYFEIEGFKLIREYGENPDYVVLGFDTTLTYEKLRIGCDYIVDGVQFLATHPDLTCPVEGGRSIPDTGSMLAMIKAATGKSPSIIIGKPNPCIINMVMNQTSFSKDEIAVIGDRLNTDILSAINAGVTSIAVLSGEVTKEEIDKSTFKPDYIFDSIKDVYNIIREV